MKGEKCCIQVDGDKEEPRKLNYPHFPLFLLPPVIWHCQRVTGWLTSACLGCCFLASQTIFFLIAIISHHFHVDGCQAVRTVNIWLKLIEQLGSAEHTHTRKKNYFRKYCQQTLFAFPGERWCHRTANNNILNTLSRAGCASKRAGWGNLLFSKFRSIQVVFFLIYIFEKWVRGAQCPELMCALRELLLWGQEVGSSKQSHTLIIFSPVCSGLSSEMPASFSSFPHFLLLLLLPGNKENQ